jgi:O-acetyl-ADP-ribose deacetylase (regulator of RNase III)
LAEAYGNSLRLAVLKQLKTVAFPSISTGAYGYPIEEASRIAVNSVKQFLESESHLEEVTFVLFTKSDYCIFFDVASGILK